MTSQEMIAALEVQVSEMSTVGIQAVQDILAKELRRRARHFHVRQHVEFTSTRGHGVITGTILSIGPKNVKMRQTNGSGAGITTWRVAKTMLRPCHTQVTA